MIVTLVPLFLAANIGLNINDWKYGPEVIYDARVDSTSYPSGQYGGIISTSNMTTKLNCRSKSRLTLSCHFNVARFVLSAIKPSGKPQIFKIPKIKKDENIGEDIFELNYEINGLASIVVGSSIKTQKLDMIRALVGQLNIGGDLSKVTDDKFELLENFTTGSCKTNYHLSIRNANDEELEEKENNDIRYDVSNVFGKQTSLGEILEIRRIRNLESCRDRVNYFFGSRHDQGIAFDTKIKSSKSLVTLRKRGFTSWTENTIIVSSKLLTISTALTERITLNLEKIVPASEPLPTINDPLTMSILTGRWLHDDTSEVKNDFI